MKGFDGKVAVVTGAGSGIGQALAIELGRSGAKLAISDVDTNGLAATEQRLWRTESRCAPLDITDLSFNDDSVDVIVSSLVIHNIPNPEVHGAGLRKAARVLRPGRKLVIADPWPTCRHAKLLRELGWPAHRRNVGWRMWREGPWRPTHLVTATKPTAGKQATSLRSSAKKQTP